VCGDRDNSSTSHSRSRDGDLRPRSTRADSITVKERRARYPRRQHPKHKNSASRSSCRPRHSGGKFEPQLQNCRWPHGVRRVRCERPVEQLFRYRESVTGRMSSSSSARIRHFRAESSAQPAVPARPVFLLSRPHIFPRTGRHRGNHPRAPRIRSSSPRREGALHRRCPVKTIPSSTERHSDFAKSHSPTKQQARSDPAFSRGARTAAKSKPFFSGRGDEIARELVHGIPTGYGGNARASGSGRPAKAVRNYYNPHARGVASPRGGGHPRGLLGVLSLRRRRQFQGQTRNRLNNP